MAAPGATFSAVSPSRLGLLVGLAVVVVALIIALVTTPAVWLAILTWALLVAVVGWIVFAVRDWRRRRD